MPVVDIPGGMEVKAPELSLPVTHGKCPVCGSTRGVYKETMERLKKEGVLPANYDLKGVSFQAPLVDPLHPPSILASMISVKIMQVTIEICAEPSCGAVYCSHVSLLDGQGQVKMGPKVTPQKFPPGY